MSGAFTAACIQFTAGPDPEPNLRQVADLVRRARDAGADLITTPEASNLIEEPRRRDEMIRRSGGRTTVPQIFIDGEHIGGCDDMVALDRKGLLDAKLGIAR